MIRKYRGHETNNHVSPLSAPPAPPARGSPGSNGVEHHANPADGRALLATIPAMLFTTLPDGLWNYVSPPFCAYTGCLADALTGLNWVAALHPADQERSIQFWQAATRSGTPWQIEHRLRDAHGTYRWFRTACAPQRDETERIIAWTGIAVPLENGQQPRSERAGQNRDTSDSVLAIVAHELRAPLTVLLGQTTLLQRRLDANPAAEPRDRLAAAKLVEQSLRLSRLLSALMDMAELDHGRLHMSAITLDLAALVGDVVQALQPTLPSHTLQLHANKEPLWVKGDALRLEQVLQNLIQNAVKYSPRGSAIAISTGTHGSQARVSVSDQGIGIPASAMPVLFQRFGRAQQNTAQGVQGLGLGLYLCKAIMELHDGSIDVQSVEGEGCTVTLLLPQRSRAPASDSQKLQPLSATF